MSGHTGSDSSNPKHDPWPPNCNTTSIKGYQMRKAGTRGETTWLAIREAAVDLIATHGFEGFNLRELAARCGIKAGSLYNHIESKEGLLKTLLESIMTDLLQEFDEQVTAIDDPVEQVRAVVRLHILFHTRRRTEVIIGNACVACLPRIIRRSLPCAIATRTSCGRSSRRARPAACSTSPMPRLLRSR